MANLKTSIKDVRQNKRRREVNDRLRRKYKKALKRFRKFVENEEVEKAQNALQDVYKSVDKASKKNVIKKNTASRIKSRSAKLLLTLKQKPAQHDTAME